MNCSAKCYQECIASKTIQKEEEIQTLVDFARWILNKHMNLKKLFICSDEFLFMGKNKGENL